ncbi:hypothetical protein D3C85_1377240 [compost metagenome]
MRGQRIRHRAAHAGLVPDITGVQADASGRLGIDPGDLLPGSLQLFQFASHERQAGAQRRQFVGGATAQATAAAGHEDGLAIEQAGAEY